MSTLQLGVIIIALFGASSLVGASLYDAVVMAPNFKGGPVGLEHGRLFMANATPAKLFRTLSPATQVLLLVAIVANWSFPERRWPLIGALVAIVLCDVITFTYHYPRLRVMLTAPLTAESARVTVAARQWASANLIRVALVIGSWCAILVALIGLVKAAHSGTSA